MSRLDDLVRRMQTQRSVLNRAIKRVREQNLSGMIIELGLGSGRTFDHLRENFPGREVITFDWEMEATKDCVPLKNQFVKGEIEKTFPKFALGKESSCALLHIDIGTRDRERDAKLYSFLSEKIVSILCDGGYVVSDRELVSLKLDPQDTTQDQLEGWPYFFYQKKSSL